LQEIISKINLLITQGVLRYNPDSIALSGGLDSSILASCIKDKKVKALTLITKDFPATDLVYAQLAARSNNLKLEIISVSIEELISAAEQTIKILKVFNPIEIRNNIVVYLTMKTAKELGCDSIMTGDGADELFAGYNFFRRLSGKDLDKDLERIWKVMHFPSRSISKSIGISLHTPFLDEQISDYAKNIPSNLKIHDEKGKEYGKWILRKAFENNLPNMIVWREKNAMQDGSGTSGLTSFFDALITDSVFLDKSKFYSKKENVLLSSKESLYYYEVYRKYFDMPRTLGKSDTVCPQCGYSLIENSHFCRMCGSYPI
jgi:asparagine synthase (glutamine-hydrolysing)